MTVASNATAIANQNVILLAMAAKMGIDLNDPSSPSPAPAALAPAPIPATVAPIPATVAPIPAAPAPMFGYGCNENAKDKNRVHLLIELVDSDGRLHTSAIRAELCRIMVAEIRNNPNAFCAALENVAAVFDTLQIGRPASHNRTSGPRFAK